MKVNVGTSGFAYAWPEFYPAKLPPKERLAYYATRLSCVEINNSFYRMPRSSVVSGWRETVPEAFSFAFKAPRRITHQLKLQHAGELVKELVENLSVLGSQLGAVLFQLPPFFKKDLPLLRAFLQTVPAKSNVAVEFRNPSWFDDNVYALLEEFNTALVGGDTDKKRASPPLVKTARHGYLRLRADQYDERSLGEWAERIAEQRWESLQIYLKHDQLGPIYAETLQKLCEKVLN